MNHYLKFGAIAMLAGIGAANAADTAETRGGITIKSADGKFEARVAGRIHFDAYLFDQDLADVTSGTEFRRARLTLQGKAYGWEYKFENDFAGQSGTEGSGWRDMYVATKIGPGKLTIGQFKPYRSMEELTSSNEITISERPFSSATGIYSGRQFQQGLGYLIGGDHYTVGLSGFSLRSGASGGARNEGIGAAGRVTFAPVLADGQVVHFGASYSVENSNKGTPALGASAPYAGRRGPSLGGLPGVPVSTDPDSNSGGEVGAFGLELAAVFGPLYAQAEYAVATYDVSANTDQEVQTYYVQASYTLTGESKPYNKGAGVFRSVKPKNAGGAWEVVARHDYIENKDANNVEASMSTVGLNWYVNPSLRFMLAYHMGDNELTGDETSQVALRTQWAF